MYHIERTVGTVKYIMSASHLLCYLRRGQRLAPAIRATITNKHFPMRLSRGICMHVTQLYVHKL
jgi:hypothetical protein